jgi:hypothetical protein
MSDEFKIGAEIEVAHPFVREEYHGFDEDGPFKRMTWRPGVRPEPVYPDDAEEVADGIGTQIITIISIHKPGRYPTRIFFTRRWRDPQGHEFGKTKLCTAVQSAFRTRCNGYRHEFRVADSALSPAQGNTP